MKKLIIGLLSIVLIAIVGVRIWSVNQDVDIPPELKYKMGEEVAIERDYFLEAYENMDGYTVTVNNAEIIPYDAYLEKYNFVEDKANPIFEPDDFAFPEMVYDLHLTVKNTNVTEDPKEHSGIAFLNYHLTGTDFLLQISSELYEIANSSVDPDFMMSFRLRPDSEMDFHLPFYFAPSAISTPIKVDSILKDDVYLGVSLYPNAKRILIE